MLRALMISSSALRLLPLLTLSLAACGRPVGAPEPDAEFNGQAIAFLNTLQPTSIAMDREMCGYLGFDAEGHFVATEAVIGEQDYCDLPARPDAVDVIATYHTHSAYGVEFNSELPSVTDVRSDRRDRVFGYISTPGGRVWRVDWRTSSAALICGLDCVASDPNFVRSSDAPIAGVYSLQDLRNRR